MTVEGRNKVAAACESCRRRKVRCSGTLPCTICQKAAIECVFDHNRRRRGPQRKQGGRHNSARNGASNEPEQDLTASMPPSGGDADADVDEGEPACRSWRLDLPESLLESARQRFTINFRPESYVFGDEEALFGGLVCHLVMVFCSIINVQQGNIICAAGLLQNLSDTVASKALCFAMCSASIKYSGSRVLQAHSRQVLEDKFAELARISLQETPTNASRVEDHDRLLRAQTLYILSSHEGDRGNGAQAWYDLVSSMGMLSTLRAGIELSPGVEAMATSLEYHIELTLNLHSLGNPSLKIHYHLPSTTSRTSTVPDLLAWGKSENSRTRTRTLVSYLTSLLLQVQSLTHQAESSNTSIKAWDDKSRHREVSRALSECHLKFSEEISFDLETYKSIARRHGDTISYALCSLLYHHCLLLLNRTFLPIPVWRDDSSPPSLVTHNETPKWFLQECHVICCGSSISIASICNQILEFDSIPPPPVVGYCCFQSGVVLISLLRMKSSTDREKVVDCLKMVFTMLGAVKEFYKPASIWVDVLFELHRSCTIRGHSSQTSQDTNFTTFFARFPGIREPPFMTFVNRELDTTEDTQFRTHSSVTASSRNTKTPARNDQPKNSQQWASAYRTQLEENLRLLTPDPDDSPCTSNPTTQTFSGNQEAGHREAEDRALGSDVQGFSVSTMRIHDQSGDLSLRNSNDSTQHGSHQSILSIDGGFEFDEMYDLLYEGEKLLWTENSVDVGSSFQS